MRGLVAGLQGLSGEQARAAEDCGRNVLVSAGAGTGKTRVLTAHYLILLLEKGYMPGQIAAVTFTNKAADEMRARIRGALREMASEFPQAGGMEKELAWAPIQTIHGFCGLILHADPLAAGVEPGFGVLEPADAELMLADAAGEALAERLSAASETEGLDEALEAFGRKGLLQLVMTAYHGFRGWGLEPEQGRGQPDAGGLLRSSVEDLAGWWRELQAAPVRPGLAAATRAGLDDLRRLSGEFEEALAQVAAGREAPLLAEISEPLGRLRAAEFKDLGALGRRLAIQSNRAVSAALGERILPVLSGLVRATSDAYERAKSLRAGLDFADLEIKARDLLRRDIPRHAVQKRYPVVLVDEFQDTNPLQWDIIRMLREGPDGVCLFAVGDVKQSIYRFRGADVRVMERLRHELEEREGHVYPLQENYRSHPLLAESINRVCAPLIGENTLYEPLLPQRESALSGARVELMAAPGDGLDREAEASFIASRLAEMLAGGEKVEDRRDGHARPVRPGDIALLFRATTDMAQYERSLRQAGLPYRVLAGGGFYRRDEVADLLQLLAAVEDEGDGPALAAVLRSPLFGVGDEGLFCLSREKGLIDGFAAGSFSLPELGEDGPRLSCAKSLLDNLRRHRHLLGFDEIISRAMAATNYWALQAAFPDYRQRLANLDKLLRMAKRYVNLGRGEIGDFLSYLDAVEDIETRESEAALSGGDDAISLLTVHRAKGIEFPVVVLPDLGRAIKGRRPRIVVGEDGRVGLSFGPNAEGKTTPIWCELDQAEADSELAEAKRLLYVAMTRARDYLLLVGSGSRGGNSWLSWLHQVMPAEDSGGEGLVTFSLPRAAPAGSSGPGERVPEAAPPVTGPAESRGDTAMTGGFPPSRMVPTLSVSAVLDWAACPRRFYLRRRLGLPEPAGLPGGDGGGSSELGTRMHILAARLAAGEKRLSAEAYVGERRLQILSENYMRSRSFKDLAEADGIETEYDFLAALSGGRLAGTADLVWFDGTGRLHLVDLKTNHIRTPGGSLLAEHSLQIQLYALALRKVFDRPVVSGRLEYLWPAVGVDVSLDEEALAAVEAGLRSLMESVAADAGLDGYEPRRGEYCRWCGFKGRPCGIVPAGEPMAW